MDMKREIIEILQKDARTSTKDMAVMLGTDAAAVEKAIQELEEDKIIIRYKAVVNWNKLSDELVQALIEVRVTPQRDRGFDFIAKRIMGFEEVKTVYLASGGFDLMVIVEGRNMREVAFFVAEKLSTMDGVLSTATHFVLRKYKENGVIMACDEESGGGRLVVSP